VKRCQQNYDYGTDDFFTHCDTVKNERFRVACSLRRPLQKTPSAVIIHQTHSIGLPSSGISKDAKNNHPYSKISIMTASESNAYMEKVRLKRKRIQNKIDSLGLADLTKKKPKAVTKSARRSARVTVNPRRSARVAKEPVKFEALDAKSDYDDKMFKRRMEIRASQKSRRKSTAKKKSTFDLGQQIGTERRDLLQPIPIAAWVSDMEYYFSVEEGNSKSNVQRVMTVVNKLVAGKGVRHPQTHNYFLEGTKIHLGMDFRNMLNEASEWVYNNGGDRGNGWLIEHPVKKLWLYQQARSHRGKPFSGN
jgi:hypothetical protein